MPTGAKAAPSSTMSVSWVLPTAPISNCCSRTKPRLTNTLRRPASPSVTPTFSGAAAAKSSRARFRRLHTGNGPMKIVFLELHDWEEAYLRKRLNGAFIAYREVLDDSHLAKIADAEA